MIEQNKQGPLVGWMIIEDVTEELNGELVSYDGQITFPNPTGPNQCEVGYGEKKFMEIEISSIKRVTFPKGVVILCEETDKEKSHVGCWSRTIDEYHHMLGVDEFHILHSSYRYVTDTEISGQFMIFGKV